MKLDNCNEHIGVEDQFLSCYRIRHDDGRSATPEEVWGEISGLRAAITGLLRFHQEGEYWSYEYLRSVETAEALVGSNA